MRQRILMSKGQEPHSKQTSSKKKSHAASKGRASRKKPRPGNAENHDYDVHHAQDDEEDYTEECEGAQESALSSVGRPDSYSAARGDQCSRLASNSKSHGSRSKLKGALPSTSGDGLEYFTLPEAAGAKPGTSP